MDQELEQKTELEQKEGSESQNPPHTTEASPPQKSNEPKSPDIRAELEAFNRSALSTLHKQNEELRNQLEALRTSKPPAPEPSASDFLSDPIPLMRKEMQATVQPLVDFVGQMRREQQYSAIKSRFKSQAPQLGAKVAELEGIIDQLMTGIEPTDQNFQAAVTQAIGLQAMGVIQSPSVDSGVPPTIPQPPAQPRGQSPVANPNLPPTPPTIPARRGHENDPAAQLKAKVDALTEEERNVARIWKMSPEQYVQYRDADSDVGTWEGIK